MITRLFAAALLCAAPTAFTQNPSPADLAARLSGTWRLNKELSSPMPGPGAGREGRRGSGPAFAAAAAPMQRGGRGSGEPPPGEAPMVTQEEAAARAALSAIQQIPQELTIEATAADMKLIEQRGPSTFKIDGKDAKVDVPGGSIKIKSRWDRASLKQEFSTAMRKLTRAWSVDANGRLVLDQRVEGVGMKRLDVQAVFDKR